MAGRTRTVVGLGIAIVVGLIAWLILKDDDGKEKSARVGLRPVLVQPSEIRARAKSSISVFWVGEIPDRRYELTKTKAGRVFVRYLSKGAKAGDKRPFLTIGTYPARNGYTALQAASKRKGARKKKLRDGGLAVVNPHGHTSAYVSYPGASYQVEIYDPIPGNAQTLAFGGHLQRVP